MLTNHLNELIDNLLIFLLQYNWLYNFQWIGDLCKFQKDSSHSIVVTSILDNLPESWKIALENANLKELQMFVSDTSNLSHWPNSLVNFSMKCRQLTRLLSQYIAFKPNNHRFPGCSFNPVSMCTDLITCIEIDQLEKCYLSKMSKKKSYEIKQISTLIQTILLSAVNDNHQLLDSSSSSSSNEIFNSNEFLLNNEHIVNHFQNVPLISKESMHNIVVKDCKSAIPLKIVDIGAGLGYLSNYLGYRLILTTDCDNHPLITPQIISIECDLSLHSKALTNLSQYNSMFQVKSLSSIVKRILFHVESTNLQLLQTRLQQFISSSNYLLIGLHCCGDLSLSIIELFQQDCLAQCLLIIGCCYHKITIEKFPTSNYLREAMLKCDINFIDKCISPATLRLACQHSPLTWFKWTEIDASKHRIRVLARIILDFIFIKYDNLSTAFERYKRLDPVIHCDMIKKLLATKYHDNDKSDQNWSLHFNDVYPHIINYWQKSLVDIVRSDRIINNDPCFTEYRDYFEQIWNLIPGLLAIQQLFQPLLETLVLFDRLWCLRECGNVNATSDVVDPYQYSGYIRIFDPDLSPRCMALFVCKNAEVYRHL
ncbi:unnamed protein product [Schistosoma turkestanicum]|nr:unnamed protein product [Schistosoma turkestanicum]